MCILFLYYLPHGSYYRLIVANNRDEVFERPTEPATFWKDHSDVLAGKINGIAYKSVQPAC